MASIVHAPRFSTSAPLPIVLLGHKERLMNALFSCRHHNFSFPQTQGLQYPPDYDSHQICTECGIARLFSWSRCEHGPYFRVEMAKVDEGLPLSAEERDRLREAQH